MNKPFFFPLLYAVSVVLFNIINWYGAKNTTTLPNITKYAIITLPIQLIAYIFLVWGFNLGYSHYKNFWDIIIISITISWFAKILTAYGFDQKLPTSGQLIALVLLIMANLVEKMIK